MKRFRTPIALIAVALAIALGSMLTPPAQAGASSPTPVIPTSIKVIPGNAQMTCRNWCTGQAAHNRGVIRVSVPQADLISTMEVTVTFTATNPLGPGEVIKLGSGTVASETFRNTQTYPVTTVKFLVDNHSDSAQISELVDGAGFIYLWMRHGSVQLSTAQYQTAVVIHPYAYVQTFNVQGTEPATCEAWQQFNTVKDWLQPVVGTVKLGVDSADPSAAKLVAFGLVMNMPANVPVSLGYSQDVTSHGWLNCVPHISDTSKKSNSLGQLIINGKFMYYPPNDQDGGIRFIVCPLHDCANGLDYETGPTAFPRYPALVTG